ncbi:MAG: hypothetical protein WEB60_09495 [Terrimicrobiaceae bacterium]
MRKLLFLLPLLIVLVSCASREVPATKLQTANVLPLAIDDAFQFRKQKLEFYSPEVETIRNLSETVAFERQRRLWGTVTEADRERLHGNYFSFFWRASTEADVTVRLEYRQAALGNYVMAQERYYPSARGSFQSDFKIIGDDYLEFGRVTSWRAVLIVDGRIVALSQSFIWR